MVVDSLSARVDVKHGGDLRLLLKEISKPYPKVAPTSYSPIVLPSICIGCWRPVTRHLSE